MATHENAVKFAWTDELIKTIIELKKEGWPASRIASEIGTTKNAVLGKLNRLGLAEKKPRLPKDSSVVAPTQSLRGKSWVARKRLVLAENGHPHLDRPPVSLMDLQHDHCRWPVTHRPPHMFCGAPRLAFRPYCECHQQMAWRRDS